MRRWLKIRWQKFLESLEENVYLYLFGALALCGGIVLSWLRSLLAGILTIPIAQWRIEHILFASTTLLILASLVYLLGRSNFRTTTPQEQDSPQLEKEVLASDVTRPTSIEIYREIWKQPPLVQEQFSKNYIGLKVRWSGTLSDMIDRGNDNLEVGVTVDSYNFFFTTSLKNHPIFRTLREGEAIIKVAGTISSAYSVIELEDAEVISIDLIHGNDQKS